MKSRGQTANDYLIGIIILLLTVTAVFGFFPTLFEPHDDETGVGEEQMAQNLADHLTENYTVSGTEARINATKFHEVVGNADPGEIAANASMQPWMNWNATIQNTTGGELETYGDNRDLHPGSTTAEIRYVRFVDPPFAANDECDPGCQLIVRVW